jgi:ATP-dependent Clp protease ATP-binding subunit ClpA
MFERFNAPARQSLFFAFRIVREHGGTHIAPEHVVLGIMSGDPPAVGRFASTDHAIEALRARLSGCLPAVPKVSEAREVPFAKTTVEAIERAVIESDDLNNREVRAEHLLLGVLVKTTGEAASALHEAGVQIRAIREFLTCAGQE